MAGQGKGIDNLRIALIGDLRYGRAVHSLCKLLTLYSNVHFTLISPPELSLGDEYISAMAWRRAQSG